MEPYWLQVARVELERGVYEIAGPESNERIEEYQSLCRWEHSDDDIPWCSSFVNWCIEGGEHEVSVVGTKSAAARSWIPWGAGVAHPPLTPVGAVVILKRGKEPQPGRAVLDAPGHVGFYLGLASPDEIMVLGGNQSNMVRISIYKRSAILACRWPSSG